MVFNDEVNFLDTVHGARLAWSGWQIDGAASIVFLAGHGSDMNGSKALATVDWAYEEGYGMTRFDYSGHGQSSGDMMDGTISLWLQDTLAVIDELTVGKVILVGSSLGGWLMMLAARARPERIGGLIGIAAAPDFTEDLIWAELDAGQRQRMMADGFIALPNPYAAEDIIYPYGLIADGRDNLVLRTPFSAPYPVRFLHGMDDAEVPCDTAEKLAANIAGTDVEVVLVKGAGHRFSEPDQLDILRAYLGEVTLRAFH